jgi:cell division protein FtsB
MNDKDHILDEVEEVITIKSQMGVRFLVGLLLVLFIAWLLLFPKIYLQNQIYYKSRDIAVLQREYDTLKEEKRIITAKVEQMRFQNQVIDTMF